MIHPTIALFNVLRKINKRFTKTENHHEKEDQWGVNKFPTNC